MLLEMISKVKNNSFGLMVPCERGILMYSCCYVVPMKITGKNFIKIILRNFDLEFVGCIDGPSNLYDFPLFMDRLS
jgi:hypothetical protein